MKKPFISEAEVVETEKELILAAFKDIKIIPLFLPSMEMTLIFHIYT